MLIFNRTRKQKHGNSPSLATKSGTRNLKNKKNLLEKLSQDPCCLSRNWPEARIRPYADSMIKGLQTFLKKQCHKIFCHKFFLANYCRPIWVLDSWVKSNYGLEFRIVWDLILPTQIKNNKIRTDFRPKSGIGHKKTRSKY